MNRIYVELSNSYQSNFNSHQQSRCEKQGELGPRLVTTPLPLFVLLLPPRPREERQGASNWEYAALLFGAPPPDWKNDDM
jgi:hypothetical protein